uniref:Uncharacterized protein n=1 Tax=Romanomermis culicivorax TaxID=13658 RepID=A0A915IM21_ROMCU
RSTSIGSSLYKLIFEKRLDVPRLDLQTLTPSREEEISNYRRTTLISSILPYKACNYGFFASYEKVAKPNAYNDYFSTLHKCFSVVNVNVNALQRRRSSLGSVLYTVIFEKRLDVPDADLQTVTPSSF